MPAMPDRWLVTRLSLGTTPDRRAVTGWVIEASGATPATTPLAQWTESGVLPRQDANPASAAATSAGLRADNVVGRLGFHDPLDDGAVGPLACLVCGWYADRSSTP
jgi:hypothetical protein